MEVEIVTPDKSVGLEMGDTNLGAHMSELYKAGTAITPDTRLVELARSGNRLTARIENTYSGRRQEWEVDQVVGDYGIPPNTELYEELKPMSRNLGELDLRALALAAPPDLDSNEDGRFYLYRIGDAWAGLNIHAAMLVH